MTAQWYLAPGGVDPYGPVPVAVDDRKAGEPIDLFHGGVVPTGPISLGSFDLSAGQHRLVEFDPTPAENADAK